MPAPVARSRARPGHSLTPSSTCPFVFLSTATSRCFGSRRAFTAEMGHVLSEKFSATMASRFGLRFSRHVQVMQATDLRQRSIDPPSFIQLLRYQRMADPDHPAADFCRANSSVRSVRKRPSAHEAAAEFLNQVKPLADLVSEASAAALVRAEVKISLGLNIPDDHFRMCYWTDSRAEDGFGSCQPSSYARRSFLTWRSGHRTRHEHMNLVEPRTEA